MDAIQSPNTYTRVVEMLSDGEWHAEPDLRGVTTFPEHWLTELAHDGHHVAQTADGKRIVRLATPTA